MYNLFVTAEDRRWSKAAYEIEMSRFLEHTDEAVAKKFHNLDTPTLAELLRLPCVFAYEEFRKRSARIGWLRVIEPRVGFIRIGFEVEKSVRPIAYTKLRKIEVDLGIRNWEMNRTHWAIKDVDLLQTLLRVMPSVGAEFEKLGEHKLAVVPEDVLSRFGTAKLHATVERARQRILSDPEGAITLARTVLEQVCKSILDRYSCSYAERDDLPALYRKIVEVLEISPSKQSDDAFRKVFSGMFSIVEGVGNLRNKLGDAHGRGASVVGPASMHARLAVNVSIATTSYLLELVEAKETSKDLPIEHKGPIEVIIKR